MSKAAEAFRTISEVADELDIQKHVLRFWEAKFAQIRPMKRGGGRRYYRPGDMELLKGIRHLLHAEGYTIKGVQKILREQGIDFVKEVWQQPVSGAKKTAVTARAEVASDGAKVRTRSRAQAAPARKVSKLRSALEKAIGELEACRTLLGAGQRATGKTAARASSGTQSRTTTRSRRPASAR